MSAGRTPSGGTAGAGATATGFVDGVRRWKDDDWWRLEARAWRAHRRVVVALAGGAPHRLWAALLEPHARSPIVGILSLLGFIGIVVAVIFGLAVSAGWMLGGAERADLAIAGALFGIVALAVGWDTWSSRSTVARDPGLFRITGLLLAVPSTLAAVGAMAAWGAGIPVAAPLGIVGIVAALVAAVVRLVVGFRRPTLPDRSARIAVEVARVPDEERRAAQGELAVAIDLLASRGLITQEQHATARAAAPGALGLALGTPRAEQVEG